jgi:LmbE family N-acetylglucosaminyl deacetylase
MLDNKYIKSIKFYILCNTYFKILRRVNSVRPEIFSDPLDNILVIAPHPDDDVLGCGGLLAKSRGKRIKVIFITDGSHGAGDKYEGDLTERRKKEARESLNYLGISDICFLNIEDGKVSENLVEISKMLKDTLAGWDNIFIPHLLDNHHDHKAATLALYGALDKIKNASHNIWFYEVWTTLIPNVLIDITDVAEDKAAAINKHQSQVNCIDYSGKIMGLNTYRAISAPDNEKTKYCEAYYRCSVNEFKHMVEVF